MNYFKVPLKPGSQKYHFVRIQKNNTVDIALYSGACKTEHISYFIGFINNTGCLPSNAQEFHEKFSNI